MALTIKIQSETQFPHEFFKMGQPLPRLPLAGPLLPGPLPLGPPAPGPPPITPLTLSKTLILSIKQLCHTCSNV